MAGKFDLIVFDWDGTLMYSAARIVASLQAAGTDIGLPAKTDEQCRNVIGLGMHEAIQNLYVGINPGYIHRFADRYRHHFLLGCTQPEVLFEGVHELLQTLEQRQLWLAVATGKGRKGLDRVLQQTDCSRYFHSTRCADETSSKPDPMMLHEIMNELDVVPERTLMVGDTVYDLEMAQRAGTAALAVSYGAHERERLHSFQPLACLNNIDEMKQWLAANI